MTDLAKCGFATQQIFAGKTKDSFGAITTPIYCSSSFIFDSLEQGQRRFAMEESGYLYSRPDNPTVNEVERKIAFLEGGEDASATGSGMGAICSTILTLLKNGDEILVHKTLYGSTFVFFSKNLKDFGIKTVFADLTNLESIKPTLTEKTKMVYFETPSNPNMSIIDIEAVGKIIHEYNKNILVVVDNTFCSPYITKPLSLGVDIVVHSATKYLNGHGDAIGGFVISNKEIIKIIKRPGVNNITGAIMTPFTAFLINRGLLTLDIRMERHSKNAMQIAKFLEGHPAVLKVYYPGLESFKGHEIAKKQMKLYGGIMSFELKGSREKVAAAINKMKLIAIGVSLGEPHTLLQHPASMTHSAYNAEELKRAEIGDGLIRLAVGLEDPEDIIADLKQVLDTLV